MSEFTKTKFKVCIIGDGGAGKTCVLFRLKNNAFNDKDYSPTIFENELIKYDWKGKTVELSLWDTAGQEDFGSVRLLAYDNIDILLIAFSVVNKNNFGNVKDVWYKEIQEHKEKFKNTKIVLISTKADLKKDSTGGKAADAPISQASGAELAKEIKAVGYFETSAKTGEGIHEAIDKGLKAAMTQPTIPKPFRCCGIF